MTLAKRQLGKTNLWLSEIGFGGASIGNLFSDCENQAAEKAVQTAFSSGINFFDTAPEYGHGLSERRMGDALRFINRDQYILSTKVGELLSAKPHELPGENKFIHKLPFHLHYDYSYDGIMRGVEDSLQRLGLNRIDLLLVHDLDAIVHNEKQYQQYFRDYVDSGQKALSSLRSQDVVQAIGLGVKQWQVCDALLNYGDYDCFMLQGNYTLLDQTILDDFLNTCLQKNISLIIAGPFASGILAADAGHNVYYHHAPAPDHIIKRVNVIQEICQAFNVSMKAAAIQFPLKHKAIASVVIGSAKYQEIQENLQLSQAIIPQSFWQTLKNECLIPQEAPI